MSSWQAIGRACFVIGVILLAAALIMVLITINAIGWHNEVMTAALIMGGVAIVVLFIAVIIAILAPSPNHPNHRSW